MSAKWGIRYCVVAVGDDDNIVATEDDLEAVQQAICRMTGFTVTILSPATSDRLTVALLRERGEL